MPGEDAGSVAYLEGTRATEDEARRRVGASNASGLARRTTNA